ncbi:hypothetical protein PV327_006758 [Microctonus hyperodae]|uniref:DUF2428 domain-containing protein n=1 Tax=Microctonus hyperodae TaxID=165561 RepID=A0AA39KIW1_MICHY|nr:hypothetical protein PV327_006758 [Microctonus hyperodae]
MDFNKIPGIDENDDDKNYRSDDILNDLKQNKNERDLKIFRKLLTCRLEIIDSTWQQVLLELLNVIIDDEPGYIDQKQLASQAFFTISTAFFCIDDQKKVLQRMLTLNSSNLFIFNEEFKVLDIDSFKLFIIHGYLLASDKTILSSNIFPMSFEVIQKYCMTYTKHIYFAFKLLNIWLKKSRDIDFWNDNNLTIEKNLEAIIFSNWDNCINEIAKINASHVFPVYLEIMRDKYNGFLEYALKTTTEYLSWLNPTKFIIVAEICKIYQVYPKVPYLEVNIFQSLTKSHLKHVGTKLYITLLDKMDLEQWNNSINYPLHLNVTKWESENNSAALHVLWELWMKPTLIKFKETLIPSLWTQFCHKETLKSASYLIKISSELGITWNQLISQTNNSNEYHLMTMRYYWEKCELSQIPPIVNIVDEYASLNIFTAYCRMKDFLNETNNYKLCENILYYNANSCSTQFRKGLFDNFEILFERVVKIRGDIEKEFVSWLHYFILDCFEPGSCYQRKLIGLKLYEIILMHTTGAGGSTKQRKNLQDGILLKEAMKKQNNWNVDNKFTLFILLKLCVDPIDEIRELSSNIINNYFNINNDLTKEEIGKLQLKAIEMNKSSKFYEIAGGVKLTLIINKNKDKLSDAHLHETLYENAKASLELIKMDLLRALTEGNDFSASLTVLLELEFQNTSENSHDNFFQRLLNLMEDATTFFLSALSPKSSDVSYSSSFAEMGIAIEETIKTSAVAYEFNENIISPAHQIVLSCIWLALKTLCELSAKISTLTNLYSNVKRSVDLIVSVLLKCRHKGAIESAGVALGMSVRYLAVKKEYYSLIDTYLDKLLSLNSNDKIDLTRRGAGLSIMFHRMISNDDKKTRRLLHKAMERLIQSLSDSTTNCDVEINSNQDCARARQLHFLRTIVADKTLHAHLVAYMETISMICFEYLQSLEWAIRNASLQLLGALIPRLVGQSSESELDFGNGYLIDHFYTHYPALAEFVLNRISDLSAFNLNSNMVPILTLISKMSVGGCDFTDYSSREYTKKLRNAVRSLFSHSVDHVRYAAAKAYAALVSVRDLPDELFAMKTENLEDKNRNFIHGHHMAQICLYSSAERADIWSETFPNEDYNKAMVMKAREFQLKRARLMCNYWLSNEDGFDKKPLCNIIEATFLQSLNMSPFWKCNNSELSYRFISFSQFLTIVERASMKNDIGASELFRQFFKLNLFTTEKIDPKLIIDCYGATPSIVYFKMKYLHKHLIENPEKLYLYVIPIIESFRISFPRFLMYSNCRVVAEICKIFIFLLNQAESKGIWRNSAFSSPSAKAYLSYLAGEIITLTSLGMHKYKKLKYLMYKIYIRIFKILNKIPLNVKNFIENSINDGDEQECLAAIDLLVDFDFFHCSTGWCIRRQDNLDKLFVHKLYITLLTDENSEVRRTVYEKLLDEQLRSEKWYFFHKLLESFKSEYDLCFQRLNQIYKCTIPKNIQVLLHNMILDFLHPRSEVIMKDALKWLPMIVDHNELINKSELESPFDQDETYREITKTFNITFILNLIDFNRNNCIFARVNYTKIIMISNYFLKNYITHLTNKGYTDLDAVINLKVPDYLCHKAKIFKNTAGDSLMINDSIDLPYCKSDAVPDSENDYE